MRDAQVVIGIHHHGGSGLWRLTLVCCRADADCCDERQNEVRW